MSADGKHEIVIIRRGGHGDHDDHHGGVWKIAFADFMTAMMAFFLVMWLISANDKTRASVARYFNPVRLVDATTQPRGLHDPKKDDSGITASPNTKDTKSPADTTNSPAMTVGPNPGETAKGREKRLDATLRDNPLAALAEIAADQHASDTPPEPLHGSVPVIGRQGGPAFRDPFAPQPLQRMAAAAPEDDAVAPTPPAAAAPPAAPSALRPKDKSVADQLAASVKPSGHEIGGPNLDVKRTNEGLLVSLTDTNGFSMFANGSAVPARRIVLLMERVAKILSAHPGAVIVRGFTDNKRFHSTHYDNWNLSMDRAQAAHYMLVRGGLADTRIAAVEGFADRGGKPGIDPASPINRRIEILVKDEPR